MKEEIDYAISELDDVLDKLIQIKSDSAELTHAKSHVKTAIKWLSTLSEKAEEKEEDAD